MDDLNDNSQSSCSSLSSCSSSSSSSSASSISSSSSSSSSSSCNISISCSSVKNDNMSDIEDIFSVPSDKPPQDTSVVHFESPAHMTLVLNGLNSLRSKDLLVDVTLIAGGQSFHAHRAVLASCSEYFRAMFTTPNLKECNQKEIRLEGVNANGMGHILEYAYTSRLCLNVNNIQDVLATASHVQLETVVEACASYLHAQMDLENCVDIATLAETYSLHSLTKRVYKFICSHLKEFSQSKDFQRLTASQMEYLLDLDYPVDCAEAEVLHIILQWVEGNSTERMKEGEKLLSKIQFQEIPPPHLHRLWNYCPILQHIATTRLSNLPHSHSHPTQLHKTIVSQLMIDPDQYAISKLPTKSLLNTRGMELAIIKVGGFGLAGVTNEITYHLPSLGGWKRLTAIPHVEQCNFGMTVMNNNLFVVGGCFNQCLQENIHPFGFRFEPRYCKWATMAPMLTERCRFTLNVVEEKLYAIGGSSENVDQSDAVNEEARACETFDPSTDTWSQIAPLRSPRTQHAGAAYNHLLFICGGLSQDVVSSTLLCYNTATNEWDETKTPMLTARADHSLTRYKDKLYASGGWCEDEAIGSRFLVTTIDEYDIIKDTWTVICEVPTPRYNAGTTIVGEKLYIIGGFHSDATFDRTTGVIECYNLETREWSSAERYPQDIWEHSCATLYIPRSRDDMDVISDTP